MKTKTFKINVSQRIIERASALFNASLKDIFNELLQNSRRAGATSVKVSVENINNQDWLILEDDGIGMFHDGVNITLGESQWNEAIQNNEYPAGMGLFSLANRGCKIEANGRSIVLEPKHFTGKKLVEICDTTHNQGTRISFPQLKSEIATLDSILSECSRYFPLPVYWQGKKLARENFMTDAIYLEEWQGLQIGVFQSGTPNLDNLNFYGLTIKAPLPHISKCLARNHYQHLWVRINVAEAPQLRLILPSRKEVIENEFFKVLQQEALCCIYRYLLKLGEHYLPFNRYLQAHEAGIELSVTYAQLEEYEPTVADSMNQSSHRLFKDINHKNQYMIVDFDVEPFEEQLFYRGFKIAYPDTILLSPNSDMEGYSWYDRLPCITDISITVTFGENNYLLNNAPEKKANQRPDEILIRLIVNSKGNEQSLIMPLDIAFYDSGDGICCCDPSYLNIFIPKNSNITMSEIVDLAFDSYFIYCDDVDSDSYENQAEYFRTELEFRVISLLNNREEAIRSRLVSHIRQHLLWLVPTGKNVTININHHRSIEVKLAE